MRTVRKLPVMVPVEQYLNRRWPDLTFPLFAFLGAVLPIIVAVGYIKVAEMVIDNESLLHWFGGDVTRLFLCIMIPVIVLITASGGLFATEILASVPVRSRRRAIIWLGALFVFFQFGLLELIVSVLNAIEHPITPVLLAIVALIELLCLGYLGWDERPRFGGKRVGMS